MNRLKKTNYCLNCGLKFHPFASSTGKFCSHSCYSIYYKGRKKSETGRINIARGNTSEKARLGGYKFWEKMKKDDKLRESWIEKHKLANSNEKHPSWKGSKASYRTQHQWLNRHYKKTSICQQCGVNKKTDWANVSGEYDRFNKEDWIELCRSCHKKHDYMFNIHKPK